MTKHTFAWILCVASGACGGGIAASDATSSDSVLDAGSDTGHAGEDGGRSCHVPLSDGECGVWARIDVESCAPFATGLYGFAAAWCSDCGWTGRSFCLDDTLLVTDAAGATTTIAVTEGYYAIALAPGRYQLCSLGRPDVRACAVFTLAEHQRLRADLLRGFDSWSSLPDLAVDGPSEHLCRTTHGNDQCFDAGACFEGTTAGTGICRPVEHSTLGEPCVPRTSANVTHSCMPKAAEVPLHCDGPSGTCRPPAPAGAWCMYNDCDSGLVCLDALGAEVRIRANETGTCQPRPGH